MICQAKEGRPSYEQAAEAVRVLLRWAGEDPSRPGLNTTPQRVVEAFQYHFSGYASDPQKALEVCLEPAAHIDGMIILSPLYFRSYCEHHIAPFSGKMHVGYLPGEMIVGIGAVLEVIRIFSHRLQLQERLTYEVGATLCQALQPKGLMIMCEAAHTCLYEWERAGDEMRLVTHYAAGVFNESPAWRREFQAAVLGQLSKEKS